ncbi:hypothetical protein [uncultured Tenacibaculum sp.]|uniref:hypothetical protein n=1 Tax=uncultured Tenacibaculum sp. TaxID=174713 RepID=UPI00261AA925|nr:hypothetical protein [uncultured Tenacibaculum sp.]
MQTTSPQPLYTLEEGQRFVKSINGLPSKNIYLHVRSLDDHYSEVELFDGVIEFMNPRTYVYGLR